MPVRGAPTVFGFCDEYSGCALDDRLDDDGRQLGRVVLESDDGLFDPTRVVVSGSPHDPEPQRVEEVGPESAVSERKGADRVPVVGTSEGQELGPAADAGVDPVLEGDLERLLDRRGAVGRKEEVRLSTGSTSASASANSTTTRFPFPSIVECATRSICRRSAASSSGILCPSVFTHREEKPSK